MANELSLSALASDAGLTAYLAKALFAKLYDPTDLRAVCSRRDFIPGQGSATVKVTKYNRAQSFTATTSEIDGSNVTNSSIGSANFTLAVARRKLIFEMSDLWRIVAPGGSFDIDLLVGVIVEATGLTMTDIITALFSGLSVTAGSQTTDFLVDYLYDGQFALNLARAPGPYTAVLRPKAFNELQADLRGEGGANMWVPATAEMLAGKGPGFKGVWNGHNIWDSDSVNADGGSSYYLNAMFAPGCFEYSEAPTPDMGQAVAPNTVLVGGGGPVMVVAAYGAGDGTAEIIGSYFPGAAEAEDARGVLIYSQVA